MEIHDFIKKHLLEEVQQHIPKLSDDAFVKGNHHEIITEKGKENIRLAIEHAINKKYEECLKEYRSLLVNIEILTFLNNRLMPISREPNEIKKEIDSLRSKLNEKHKELLIIEDWKEKINNR